MKLTSKANSLLVSCLSLTLFFSGCGQNGLIPGENTSKTQLASPVFNIPSGTFTNSVDISLSCPESGADIYYTTDFTDPSNLTINLYKLPLHLTATTTIKAIAYKEGMTPSVIVAATYTKSETATLANNKFTITTSTSGDGTVSINPPGGSYENGSTVQLTAIPSLGSTFDHWEGDVAGTTNPINVTVNANKSAKAFFTLLSATGVATTITGTSVVLQNPPLTQNMSGTLTVSCSVIANPGVLQSVTADLSQIGGSNIQLLTTQGNNLYSWTGSVTPPTAGQRKIIFTAVDNTTSVYAATYVPVAGPPAPPSLINATVNPVSLIQQQDMVSLSCTVTDPLKTVTSVVVDLSGVGGVTAQSLTKGLNNQWTGIGAVNPASTGDKAVTFTATNDAGASASTVVSVTVAGTNAPPVITVISPTAPGNFFKGQSAPVLFSCSVTDTDDTVQSVVVNLSQFNGPIAQPLTKAPDPSNVWSWTSPAITLTSTGNKTITFLATDSRRGTTTKDVTLIIAGLDVTKPTTAVTDHLNSVEVSWNIIGLTVSDLAGKQMRFQVLRTNPSGPAWDITSSFAATTTGTYTIDASYLPPGTYTIRGMVFIPAFGVTPEQVKAIGDAPGEIIVPVGYLGAYDLTDMAAATTKHFSPIDGTIFEGYNINDGAGFQVTGLGALNDPTGTYGDFMIFSRYGQELTVGNAGSGYLIRGSANINHLPGSPAPNVSVVDLNRVTGPNSPVTGSILLLPMDNLSVPSTNFDTIKMTSNKIVMVEFEKIPAREALLTTSVVGGTHGHGTIDPITSPVSPTGDSKYYAGTKVTLTAIPDAGYRVKQWNGTDKNLAGSLTDVVTMNGDKSVNVEFELIPAAPGAFDLTVSVVGGHGTILPNGNYDAGVKVTLTATPEDGYEVKAWNGTNDDTKTGLSNSVDITAPTVVTVEFQPIPGALSTLLTSIKGGHGTLNIPLGTLSYPVGTTVHLEAIPDAGWRVKEWTGTDRTNPTYSYDVLGVPDISTDGKGDLMIGCPDAAPLALEIENNTLFPMDMTDPYEQVRTYGWGSWILEPMHVDTWFPVICRADKVSWLGSAMTPESVRSEFVYGRSYLPGDRLKITTVDEPPIATVTLSKPTKGATLGTPDIAKIDYSTPTQRTIKFSDSNYCVKEGTPFALINVLRSEAHVSRVSKTTVICSTTTGGTAVDGVDYISTFATLELGKLATLKIPILSNINSHEDKTVNLKFGTETAVLTIVDATGIATVTPTASDVIQGKTFTYTVSLDYIAGSPVTVKIASDGYADVSPNVLTFTPTTDQTPPPAQTVTVTGIVAGFGHITHTVTSDDPNFEGIPASPVTVKVIPADIPNVVIKPSGLPARPGFPYSYNISLTVKPATGQTVAVNLATPINADGGSVSVLTPNVLIFNDTNYEAGKTVILKAATNGTGEVIHTIAPTPTPTPPPPAGIYVSATASDIQVGQTFKYQVRLITPPTSDVTLMITPDPALSVTPSSLTFTSTDWNTLKEVTVTSLASATNPKVTHTATSVDPLYTGLDLSSKNVTFKVINQPTASPAGVIISPTKLVVTAGGSSSNYTVVLNTQPTKTVTITLTKSGGITRSPNSLTFTSANWNVPQSVNIIGTTAGTGKVVHSAATSLDPAYQTVTISDMNVTINAAPTPTPTPSPTPTPTPGIYVTATASDIQVGGTFKYQVKLISQPTNDVTLMITPDPALSVTPSSLTFKNSDWDALQEVTVTSLTSAVNPKVTHTASSTDPAYAGPDLSSQDITFKVFGEVTTPGVSISPVGRSDLAFGGSDLAIAGTFQYDVVLKTQPLEEVTITVAHSGAFSTTNIDTTGLTFTPANWKVAQTVTVTGAAAGVDTLSHTATSFDTDYNVSGIAPVVANVIDPATPKVIITPTNITTLNRSTFTYKVKLSTAPTANVTINVGNDTKVQVLPKSLTFTIANYSTEQTVTVKPITAGTSPITHTATSTDPNYNISSGISDVTANITSQDHVIIQPTKPVLTVGGSSTYTVVLGTPPDKDVTITLTKSGGITCSPNSLTFTSSNSKVPQSVNIIGTTAGTGKIVHSAATSQDVYYKTVTISDLNATINAAPTPAPTPTPTPTPTPGIYVTATASDIQVGGTFKYQVKLISQPTSDVTLMITPDPALSVSPSPLVFTNTDWNTLKEVTVTSLTSAVNPKVTHAASSADPAYSGPDLSSQDITFKVIDQPTASPAGVIISPTKPFLTVGGPSSTYTVVLNTQPTQDVTITLTKSGGITCSPNSLTFTSGNWNVAQPVTILGTTVGTGKIVHSATSTDTNYNAVAISDVDATIIDPIPTLTPTPTPVAIVDYSGVLISNFTATIAPPVPAPPGTLAFSTQIAPDNTYIRPTMLGDANMNMTVLRTNGCKNAVSVTWTFDNGEEAPPIPTPGTIDFGVGEVSKTINFPLHKFATNFVVTPDGNRGAFYMVTSQKLGMNPRGFDMKEIGNPVLDAASADTPLSILPCDDKDYPDLYRPIPYPFFNLPPTTNIYGLKEMVGNPERSMMGTAITPGTSFAASISLIPDISKDGVPDLAVVSKTADGITWSNPHPTYRAGAGYATIFSASSRFTSLADRVGRIFWDDIQQHISLISMPAVEGISPAVTDIIGPAENSNISGITSLGRVSPANNYANFASGDFNGDGLSDFAVNCPGILDAGGNSVGASYLVLMRPILNARSYLIDLATFNSGTLDGWDATSLDVPVLGISITGTTELPIDQNVQAAGNFNGASALNLKNPQGPPIPLTGAVFAFPNATVGTKAYCGKIVIMFGQEGLMGNFSINDIGSKESDLIKGLVIEGENAGDRFGARVCCAGDVNGDGVDDLLVSAPNAGDAASGKTNCGKVYLIYGKAGIVKHNLANPALTFVDYTGNAVNVIPPQTLGDGPLAVIDIVTTLKQGALFRGEMSDAAIEAISPAGDANGDGFADFLIGSPNSNVTTPTSTVQQKAGKSYLILGRSYTLPIPTPTPAP
jgi:hypothetical protein